MKLLTSLNICYLLMSAGADCWVPLLLIKLVLFLVLSVSWALNIAYLILLMCLLWLLRVSLYMMLQHCQYSMYYFMSMLPTILFPLVVAPKS